MDTMGIAVTGEDRGATRLLQQVEDQSKRTTSNIVAMGTGAVAAGNLIVSAFSLAAQKVGDHVDNMIRRSAELDHAVRALSTIKPDIDMSAMNARLNEMQTRIPQSAKAMGAGLYDIFSSIEVSVKDGVELLEKYAKGAIAAETDTKTFGTAITGIMNAYKMDVSDADRISDVFFNTVRDGVVTGEELARGLGSVTAFARSAGVSIEEMGAMIAGSTKEGGVAAENLNHLSNLLQQLPTRNVTNDLNLMGVATETLSGKLRSPIDILTDLKTHLEGLTQAERAMVLQQIFPDVQAREAATVLISQLDFVKEALERNKTQVGITQQAYEIMAGSAVNQGELFKNTWNALATDMGNVVQPALINVMQTARDVLQNIRGEVQTFRGTMDTIGSSTQDARDKAVDNFTQIKNEWDLAVKFIEGRAKDAERAMRDATRPPPPPQTPEGTEISGVRGATGQRQGPLYGIVSAERLIPGYSLYSTMTTTPEGQATTGAIGRGFTSSSVNIFGHEIPTSPGGIFGAITGRAHEGMASTVESDMARAEGNIDERVSMRLASLKEKARIAGEQTGDELGEGIAEGTEAAMPKIARTLDEIFAKTREAGFDISDQLKKIRDPELATAYIEAEKAINKLNSSITELSDSGIAGQVIALRNAGKATEAYTLLQNHLAAQQATAQRDAEANANAVKAYEQAVKEAELATYGWDKALKAATETREESIFSAIISNAPIAIQAELDLIRTHQSVSEAIAVGAERMGISQDLVSDAMERGGFAVTRLQSEISRLRNAMSESDAEWQSYNTRIQSVVQTIANDLPPAMQAAFNRIAGSSDMGKALESTLERFGINAGPLLDKALRGTGAIANAAARDIGTLMREGLEDGILGRQDAIGEAFRRVLENAVQGATAFLEAHSPSALTARVLGKPMVDGIEQEIEQAEPLIQMQMIRIVTPSRAVIDAASRGGEMMAAAINVMQSRVSGAASSIIGQSSLAVATALTSLKNPYDQLYEAAKRAGIGQKEFETALQGTPAAMQALVEKIEYYINKSDPAAKASDNYVKYWQALKQNIKDTEEAIARADAAVAQRRAYAEQHGMMGGIPSGSPNLARTGLERPSMYGYPDQASANEARETYLANMGRLPPSEIYQRLQVTAPFTGIGREIAEAIREELRSSLPDMRTNAFGVTQSREEMIEERLRAEDNRARQAQIGREFTEIMRPKLYEQRAEALYNTLLGQMTLNNQAQAMFMAEQARAEGVAPQNAINFMAQQVGMSYSDVIQQLGGGQGGKQQDTGALRGGRFYFAGGGGGPSGGAHEISTPAGTATIQPGIATFRAGSGLASHEAAAIVEAVPKFSGDPGRVAFEIARAEAIAQAQAESDARDSERNWQTLIHNAENMRKTVESTIAVYDMFGGALQKAAGMAAAGIKTVDNAMGSMSGAAIRTLTGGQSGPASGPMTVNGSSIQSGYSGPSNYDTALTHAIQSLQNAPTEQIRQYWQSQVDVFTALKRGDNAAVQDIFTNMPNNAAPITIYAPTINMDPSVLPLSESEQKVRIAQLIPVIFELGDQSGYIPRA